MFLLTPSITTVTWCQPDGSVVVASNYRLASIAVSCDCKVQYSGCAHARRQEHVKSRGCGRAVPKSQRRCQEPPALEKFAHIDKVVLLSELMSEPIGKST